LAKSFKSTSLSQVKYNTPNHKYDNRNFTALHSCLDKIRLNDVSHVSSFKQKDHRTAFFFLAYHCQNEFDLENIPLFALIKKK
jgi:hypothetical protein